MGIILKIYAQHFSLVVWLHILTSIWSYTGNIYIINVGLCVFPHGAIVNDLWKIYCRLFLRLSCIFLFLIQSYKLIARP